MARRKTTRRKTTATKRRATKRRAPRKKNSSKMINFFLPLFFIGCILFCLGFLLFMGYRTVTASSFFDMEKVATQGVVNVSQEEIEKIVQSHTAQEGVWNADIDAIKNEVENLKYAREVSVSKVLPDTVRVIVQERIPRAVVRLEGKDFWVDEDGLVLNRISQKDEHPPFTMFGWSEQDSEEAQENNKKRVALYLELIDEWKSYSLAEKVKAIDLSDLKDVHAIVENSGKSVEIRLGETDFGTRLKKGIETIAGSDECIEYLITRGDQIVKGPCKS